MQPCVRWTLLAVLRVASDMIHKILCGKIIYSTDKADNIVVTVLSTS